MPLAYLGLGSNEGPRAHHLQMAVHRLHVVPGAHVTAVSPVYESEAHTLRPEETQPPFLNAVAALETRLSPEALLREAQRIERVEGRQREEDKRWQPRPLDIDLLVVGAERRDTDMLSLPHPRLADRRFVLRPWADLAPNLRVPPPFDRPVRALLAACPDTAALASSDVTLTIPGTQEAPPVADDGPPVD
ncbi:MAG: 2-amino-4-hydroxy-6-hydroxymethyldihydropteridine diphosphokinase [Salinivenus sp.]